MQTVKALEHEWRTKNCALNLWSSGGAQEHEHDNLNFFSRFFFVKRGAQQISVTSFASPDLAKLGWSLVLVAAEEVVGVLQATGEREVILVVAVVAVMSHFLFAVWQHLRHAESTKPGAQTAAAVPFIPPSFLSLRERGQKNTRARTHTHT